VARQQEMKFRTWGGARPRKRRGAGRASNVPHVIRPLHQERHPVHVTLRALRRLPSLRQQRVFREVVRALPETTRDWFRVVHFSVQIDHVHLLVEARDKVSLSRGVGGVSIRLARAVNRLLRRRGRVWSDRYHARPLPTPREVRNALVYVVMNWTKHVRGSRGLDPYSSAWWLEGWKVPPSSGPPHPLPSDPPVEIPRSWLLKTGWKRRGEIASDERTSARSRDYRK
jgi:putative transposase